MTRRAPDASFGPSLVRTLRHQAAAWWRGSRFHRIVGYVMLGVAIILGIMFGIAKWYLYSGSGQQAWGVSFVPSYARYLGLDPHATYTAILHDLQVKHLRLVSYWDEIEPTPGNYDFSELDWEFAQANAAHAKISLSIGLRQPRWPECHPPSWVDTARPAATWYPQLADYMTAVINRYKHDPALESYQLENEYFLSAFGTCQNFDRARLEKEAALIRSLDPGHQLIISRSNNGIGWATGKPIPDEYGISLYRRVWDVHTSHYYEHPEPAWYYAFLAGAQKLINGHDTIIHEMQAEPWPLDNRSILDTSLAEQNKSFDAARFQARFTYARNTGMPSAYFWGAEYWYYRKEVLHDDSIWHVAQHEFTRAAN